MRVRLCRRLLFWLLLASAGSLVGTGLAVVFGLFSGEPQPPQSEEAVRCGPISLQIAANRLGIPWQLADILAECKIGPNGTSLAELRKYALAHGCQARSARVTWEALRQLNTACVLHVADNHFVAVDPVEHNPSADFDSIRVYDPNSITYWASRADLEAIWSGATLILDRPQASAREGPAIEFDSCWTDKGFFSAEEPAEFVIRFRNPGTQPATVKVLSSSCLCTTVKLSHEVLPPNQEGSLQITVAPGGKRGRFRQRVLLETSDPAAPLVPVTIAGTVISSSLISTRKVSFGEVSRGGKSSAAFVVHDPETRNLQVIEGFPAWSGQKAPAGVACSVERSKIESEEDVPDLVLRNSAAPGDYLVNATVTLEPDCPLGQFSGRIVLETNLPAPWSKLTVPFRGQAVSDVSVEPEALLLHGRGKFQRELALSRRANRPLSVVRAEIVGDVPLRVVQTRQTNPSAVRVILQLDPPENPAGSGSREIDGKVVCHVEGGGSLEIPVVWIPGVSRD